MSSFQDTILRSYLLVLGLLFHTVLLSAYDLGTLPLAGLAGMPFHRELNILVIGLYIICGIGAIYMSRPSIRRVPRGWIIAVAVVPLSYHIALFSNNWALSLTGITFTLTQFHILLTLTRKSAAPQLHSEGRHKMADAWVDVIILASLTTLAVVLILVGHHLVESRVGIISGLLLVLLTLGASLIYELENYAVFRHRLPRASHVLLLAALIALVIPVTQWSVFPLLAIRQLTSSTRLWLEKRSGNQMWRYLTTRPPMLLVGGFAMAILAGTALLALPAADAHGEGLPAVDALFTATSATCVTGLIVVDTGSDLTLFGQLVVLGLIQAGGLGIMTISTFVALLMGRNIGLRGESALKETITENSSRGALRLVKFIVGATLIIELLGAVWLAIWWVPTENWASRIYGAAFHSVSAFCNAGFSLFSDSLMGFGNHPGVPLGVSTLIILGGLGFSVLFCGIMFRRQKTPQSVHVKMVLWTSGILLVAGTLILYLIERRYALSGTGAGGAMLHAWFQSVTARTAGFNTLDIGSLRLLSQVLLMVLMFIGGAPGSTAGGIKVTTFAIMILVIRSVLQGRSHVIFQGRRIEMSTVLSAVALTVLSAMAVVIAGCLLLITHNLPARGLAFETISAFGTVGLSTGITSSLNLFGKLLITGLMFMGRLGPLTILLLIRPLQPRRFEYPDANVMIG